jgi:hypothetical protein
VADLEALRSCSRTSASRFVTHNCGMEGGRRTYTHFLGLQHLYCCLSVRLGLGEINWKLRTYQSCRRWERQASLFKSDN